ncbi:MAG: ABC transporter ATP-binding protein [Bacteroidales bacterium]|nr:ABC transporter ATP-binding protein [Bacteroidales bacterium]
MLNIVGISKSFGQLKVLDDITLSVAEREIVAIVGPSGAGKTTLLQIAGTLERPDTGRVEFNGREVTSLSDRKLSEFRNRHMGFVFQFHQLLPELTACENVALPAMIGGESKGVAMKRAAELLDRFGLGDRLTHKPGALSGGEKQRAAIARALINNPGIIFADEPTGSLDSANRDEIQHHLVSLRDTFGQSVIMVTHDPSLASIADRVITLRDGRIVTEDNFQTTSTPE